MSFKDSSRRESGRSVLICWYYRQNEQSQAEPRVPMIHGQCWDGGTTSKRDWMTLQLECFCLFGLGMHGD